MLPGRKYKPEDFIQILWNRRWLLVVPLFLGIMGGLLYSRTQPDRFESDALIQVVPQRVPDSYVQSTITSRVEDRIKSLSEQVLSRTQLERVIVELDLYPELRRAMPMEDVVQVMHRAVRVENVVNRLRWPATVDGFRVFFSYTNAQTAQRVVDRISRLIIDENARDRSTLAESTSAFMDSQLADARKRLEAQEQKLKEFRERYADRLPTQMQTNMSAITQLQLQMQALVESMARDRDRKLMLERLLGDAIADLSAMTTASNVTALTTPQADPSAGPSLTAGTPQQRLDAARAVLAQLELRLKPEHPDMVRTKRLIRDLEQQVAADEAARPLTPDQAPATGASADQLQRRERVNQMRAELESLGRQMEFKETEERRIRTQLAAYQARLESVPGLESEWIALTRDYDTLSENYRDLLGKTENSRVAANLEQRQIGEQFRVIDPPSAPNRPYSPNRLQIMAVAIALGLGLGVGLIGLLEYRDTTMKTEADVVGALALPVLTLVPYVPTAADAVRAKRWRWVVSATVVVVGVASGSLVWWLQLWKYAL